MARAFAVGKDGQNIFFPWLLHVSIALDLHRSHDVVMANDNIDINGAWYLIEDFIFWISVYILVAVHTFVYKQSQPPATYFITVQFLDRI